MRSYPPLVLLLAASLAAAAPPVPDAVDSPMYLDPPLPTAEVVRTFPPGLLDLWLAALDRADEPETQARAALAVALACERGMPGLTATVPKLTRNLEQEKLPQAAALAAAKALIALDAKESAAALFARSRSESAPFRELVEPALAGWNHRPAREVWLGRLTAARPKFDRDLTLAIRELATVREEEAAPMLADLARSPEAPPAFRLEAARGLVAMRPSGADVPLVRLTDDAAARSTVTRLVAATLLRQHAGPDAIKLLQTLAGDAESAVAAVAVARLFEIDPSAVLSVFEAVVASPDEGVRSVGVKVLARYPTAENVRRLGDRLDDPHPDVRAEARRALRQLAAEPDRRAGVVEQAVRAVGDKSWRAQEQGAMLLAQLGLTGEVKRLLPLLDSDRPEVMVAAAWAVRVLDVPDTLTPVLEHVNRLTDRLLAARTPAPREADQQLAQLIQLLGQRRHAAADATFRKIMPRFVGGGQPPARSGNQQPGFTPLGGESRAAAIWALGLLYEGKSDERLVAQVIGRLDGDPGMGPDDQRVRRMSAVALGRMKAASARDILDAHAHGIAPTTDPVEVASRWALTRLTGAEPPPPGRVEVPYDGWFLVPAK